MKNWKLKLSALILAAVTLMVMIGAVAFAAEEPDIVASGECGDNITWVLDGNGTLYLAGSGNIVGSPWRDYKDTIYKIVLEEGITTIGVDAFAYCSNLTEASLPDSISVIGVRAFIHCANLELEKLPSGLTTLGANAFQSCSKLALTELPEGLTVIPMCAFAYCPNLALTRLSDKITIINDTAFRGTGISLTSLPKSLTYIGWDVFRGCNQMILTELPDGITSKDIGGTDAFLGVRWRIKTEHYIPDGNGDYALKEITETITPITSSACLGFQDYSEDGLIPVEGSGYLGRANYYLNGESPTIKCYYEKIKLKVTIRNEGSSTTQEVPYGGKATEPELDPRPGQTLSWVTADGEPFSFDDPITEPITVSPVWTPKEGTITGEVIDQDGRPVSFAHVVIVAGNTTYLETDADANGIFWVYNVPYGSYNAVASKRNITATSLLVLDSAVEECKVILPDTQTNSVLMVNRGTKDVVVGGLDALFNSEIYNDADQAAVAAGGAVTVQMTVKAATAAEIPDAADALNAAAAADGKTIFGYMVMDVAKITETVDGSVTEENIPELPQLLQIIDPLSEEQKGKVNYAVYRMHEGHVYTITETPNENGAYITVSDDTLTIFASKFSEYCLAFEEPKPTPDHGADSSDDDDDDDGRRNPFIDVKPNDWFYDDVLDAYYAGYMEGITSNTFEPDAPLTRAQAAYTFAKVAKAQLKGLEITGDFEDVTKVTTYAEAITWANDAGVEIGYGNGKFGPRDSLTREQLALMLYRTYGSGQVVDSWEGDFTDLDDVSDWSEAAVRWAVHADLLKGTDAGELLPQGRVTRAEAAALIMRIVGGKGK